MQSKAVDTVSQLQDGAQTLLQECPIGWSAIGILVGLSVENAEKTEIIQVICPNKHQHRFNILVGLVIGVCMGITASCVEKDWVDWKNWKSLLAALKIAIVSWPTASVHTPEIIAGLMVVVVANGSNMIQTYYTFSISLPWIHINTRILLYNYSIKPCIVFCWKSKTEGRTCPNVGTNGSRQERH